MYNTQLEKYPVLKMIKDIQNVNEIKKCPESEVFIGTDNVEVKKLDTNIKLKINEEQKIAITSCFFFTPNKGLDNCFDINKEEYWSSSILTLLVSFKNLMPLILKDENNFRKYFKGIYFNTEDNKLIATDGYTFGECSLYEEILEKNTGNFIMPLSMVKTIIQLNKFYKENYYSIKMDGKQISFETNSFKIIQNRIEDVNVTKYYNDISNFEDKMKSPNTIFKMQEFLDFSSQIPVDSGLDSLVKKVSINKMPFLELPDCKMEFNLLNFEKIFKTYSVKDRKEKPVHIYFKDCIQAYMKIYNTLYVVAGLRKFINGK